MKKKGGEEDGGGNREQRFNKTKTKTKMKRNMQRLGGSGLSLEAFANSRSGTSNYNPSLIKKQREFYKNAKLVSKYKRSLKQKEQLNDAFSSTGLLQNNNASSEAGDAFEGKKRSKKKAHLSAKALYEKTVEAEEKARREREAMRRAKEEERQRVEGERKALREKMLKKTKWGQPVMKYRIDHILDTLRKDV